jgi:hypothetical protein
LLQKGLKGTVGQGKESRKKSNLTEKKSQKKMSRERDTKDKMFQDLSSEPDAKRTKGSRASELSRGAAESKNVPGGEASTEKVSNRRRCQGNKMARKLKKTALASFL